jgi:DNA replication protein DnaC
MDETGKPSSYYRRPTEFPTEERICEKHGPYIAKNFKLLGEVEDSWSSCRGCQEERQRAIAEKEREQERAQMARRAIENAGIPVRYRNKTLADFETASRKQREVVEVARDYIARFGEHLSAGRCLIFCGTVGTGKTHIACSMAQALAEAERSVRYLTVVELIQLLRATWRKDSKQSEIALLRDLERLDLLVLDEVGVQYASEAEQVQLFDVLNRRYAAMRPIIVIGNVDLEGLRAYLGDRTVDRLRENGGRLLVFDWESHRGTAAPQPPALPKVELRPEDSDSRLAPDLEDGWPVPRKTTSVN